MKMRNMQLIWRHFCQIWVCLFWFFFKAKPHACGINGMFETPLLLPDYFIWHSCFSIYFIPHWFLLHMSAAVHQPDSLITLFALSSYIFRSMTAPLILQLWLTWAIFFTNILCGELMLVNKVVEYSTDLHNGSFHDILSTTQTLGPWRWAQMQIQNALSWPTLKLTKGQTQRFNRQKGKPWNKTCSDLYLKSLLLWFPPPIAQQDDIFRGLCGLLVFSSVHTVNGLPLFCLHEKGASAVKTFTVSCVRLGRICDACLGSARCFLFFKPGKCCWEKNKRLIKHQGANRANNRQDKVKHIDLNTQEQGKVIGHTGAAH